METIPTEPSLLTGQSAIGGSAVKPILAVPDHLHQLLKKLEFFGSLQPNQKPNVGNFTFSDSSSWSDWVTRRFSRETKEGVVRAVENTVKETIEALNNYRQTDFLPLIVSDFRLFQRGIKHLLTTYQNDHGILADIRSILKQIELYLRQIDTWTPDNTTHLSLADHHHHSDTSTYATD